MYLSLITIVLTIGFTINRRLFARKEELKVSTVFVNEAPTLKRFRARAKGRANHILKRTCHITVKVAEFE
jgi:hypothetical protein